MAVADERRIDEFWHMFLRLGGSGSGTGVGYFYVHLTDFTEPKYSFWICQDSKYSAIITMNQILKINEF